MSRLTSKCRSVKKMPRKNVQLVNRPSENTITMAVINCGERRKIARWIPVRDSDSV